MRTTWLIDMRNKPKLRGYITFKTTLIVSSHVEQHISKPRIFLLIQLITGILPIVSETGRYTRLRDIVTKHSEVYELKNVCVICVTFLKQKTKFTLY